MSFMFLKKSNKDGGMGKRARGGGNYDDLYQYTVH